MANFEFELNKEGVKTLLQSEEMQSALIQFANSYKGRVGDDYDVYVGRYRANVSIQTKNNDAFKDNLKNNTLLRSLQG